MTKEASIHTEENTASSINSAGKIRQNMQKKNQTGLFSCMKHKNKFKIKDLNVRLKNIKLVE